MTFTRCDICRKEVRVVKLGPTEDYLYRYCRVDMCLECIKLRLPELFEKMEKDKEYRRWAI